MTTPVVSAPTSAGLQLSLAMPCYNEADGLRDTVSALAAALTRERIQFELVLVDNGSTDRTGAIIDELIAEGHPIRKMRVERNQGYGHGIVTGLDACRAPLIGYLCADGQVGPEDVARTYRLMANREERVLAKVRRRFRQDSWKRKIVSIIYNFLMLGVFGWLGAIDINGSPKIFSRRVFRAMKLVSTDWFLDPEIMIKAKALGLRVIEIDVEGYARHGGVSNVRRQTILEFLKNIWRYRTGAVIGEWRRGLGEWRLALAEPAGQPVPAAVSDDPFTRVRVLEQRRVEDARGYLQKILMASQVGGHAPKGEVYVTAARPGEAKGNHWHRRMGEWFAVVQGEGAVHLLDPGTGARREIPCGASRPRSVYVPSGLAHAVVNTGPELLVCVAWAEGEHDPGDVFPCAVWPPA